MNLTLHCQILITQFIDVRDLAQLTLNIIESNKNGPFNIVGRSFKWNEFISIFASVGALDVVNSTDESFPLFDSTKSTGLRTLRSRHDFINNHEFISLEQTLIDWFRDIQY
jgi:nucleoside-diphosphate-sugar epimerase